MNKIYYHYLERTTSGYHNVMFNLIDQFLETGLFEITTKLNEEDIDYFLTNGRLKMNSDKAIHYLHFNHEYSNKAFVNLSTKEFYVNTFVLPPRIKKLNVQKGNLVTIADFKKNIELGDYLIQNNPDIQFKAIVNSDNFPIRENCIYVKQDPDIEKMLFFSSKILCISNVDYESYGLLPMECCSTGIPTYISNNYSIPFTEKIEISNWDYWNQVVKTNEMPSNNETNWKAYSEYQLERFDLFMNTYFKNLCL